MRLSSSELTGSTRPRTRNPSTSLQPMARTREKWPWASMMSTEIRASCATRWVSSGPRNLRANPARARFSRSGNGRSPERGCAESCGGFALSTLAQGPSRPGPGVVIPVEHNLAIDDHSLDSLVVLKRLEVRRAVDDFVGVEQGDVGELAHADQSAVGEAQFVRIQRGHFTHRVFEPQQAPFAHVNAKHARKRAEAARVGMTPAE